MADISKIKLPSGDEYDIKSLRTSLGQLIPEQSKTFTGVIATANNDPSGYLYFGWIKPVNYNTPWRLRYRIYSTIAGLTNNQYGYYDVEMRGMFNTYHAYDMFNQMNTSYRPLYSHILYCCTATGINNGYGPLIGIRLHSSYNPTTTANSRTFKIDIIETENCTFTFYDNMLLYANVPGTGTTNYVNRYLMNGADNGHKMYGDANSTIANHLYHYNNVLARKAIVAESMIVGDSTGFEKVGPGVTFDISYPILWSTAAVAVNASNYANMFFCQYDRNMSTGIKSGYTSAPNKVQYLIVTISGNTATIDSNIITDTLPTTDDGKVYIVLGKLGNQSTGSNYFLLYPSHPMYWYKNGAIRPYGTYGNASTSEYGITKLNTATNSTSTTTAATSSAVKTAYDLANTANGTANSALSGVNGNLIYDQTFTISNGVATFAPHVYQKGQEVTTNYAKSCFVWKYRTIDGTEVSLTTNNDRGCTVTISGMGYGGHVIGIFTPA